MSILDLNQDCFDNIFKYLSIYELIDVEGTCRAFKYTCELAYESKRFRAFRIELRYFKTEYLRDIFRRIGDTLRSFEFSGGYIMDELVKQTVIEGVTDCTNLKKLSINYVQFTKEQFEELSTCFTILTHLDLSHCNINERNLEKLDGDSLPNIKTLKLVGNAAMSGEFFCSMKHVEALDVSFCFGLRYYWFRQFLKNCLKLIELDLTGSSCVVPEDVDILEQILLYQPNIEKLILNQIGIERNEEILSKFRQLKYSSVTGRKFGL